jgi:adiponectin receptor
MKRRSSTTNSRVLKKSLKSPPPPPPPPPTLSSISRIGSSTLSLLSFDHLKEHHDYMADNEWIMTGYRPPSTFWGTFGSLFSIHNETMNVWSHLIGALYFLASFVLIVFEILFGSLSSFGSNLSLSILSNRSTSSSSSISNNSNSSSIYNSTQEILPQAPAWPIAVFLASAAFCLLTSTTFHLFYPVNKSVFEMLVRLDYVGIAALISGSCYPLFVYGFWCEPFFMALYLIFISTLCLSCVILGMMDSFRTREWRFVRTACFMAAGLGNIFPLCHLIFTHPLAHEEVRCVIFALLAMGAQYVGGALIYANRIPERLSPGSFDNFGSHVIWHFCVLGAAITHYYAVMTHWRWRSNHLECK